MSRNEYICDCKVIHHDVVEHVLNKMPNKEVFLNLANLYKILGDETRCKIVYCLKENEMCVCDLANVLSMTKSSISHQLATMKKFGIVKSEKRGKEVFYSLDDEHIFEIYDMGLTHISHK